MINCIVVDDEPIGREGIADYITEIDSLKLVGLCKDAIEASNLISEVKVDLIFLDIHLPKINGLDFLKTLKNPPLVIVCTAYPSYALEGYDLNVLDYLVKPITYQRFLKACNKAKSQFDLIAQSFNNQEQEIFFFIKCDNKFVKVLVDDILYIESLQNYVKIYCSSNTYVTLLSLKSVLRELPESKFMQIHKSYIANVSKISMVDGNQVIIDEAKLPISRTLRLDVYNRVMQNRLIKK